MQFKNIVKERWSTLSGLISSFLADQLSEETIEFLKYSMARNFACWENLPVSYTQNRWLNDMQNLKNWFSARIEWLDNVWSNL